MRLATVLAVQIALLVGAASAARATTQTYLFRDSFAPVEGTGDALVPVSNATGAIVSSGPDFVNGAFVTETISASACSTTPTIRAWSFPDQGGLLFANASPTVVTGTYSISMLLRYDPMDSGYARLIDFSNSTLDTGIYKYGDGVSFYPVGEYAAGSFVQGQDVFVTITRRGDTKEVDLYIDGAPSGTYVDTGDLYAPSATAVYFLMDNTTGSAAIDETDPGVIAYLQVRDTTMTPEEVTASLASICEAVASSTCDAFPAVSYESVLCRIAALLDRVRAESRLGTFQAKLAKSLQIAQTRTGEAQALGSGKKAKKKLQQAARALTEYAHRLSSLSARKKLKSQGSLRTDFLSQGNAITPDVKRLRAQL